MLYTGTNRRNRRVNVQGKAFEEGAITKIPVGAYIQERFVMAVNGTA